jgi:glycosyltransferase involved in cell wall biosynthesis
MMKVSGCVLTYNEEKHLPEVLENLSFCDEIIVLDHHSTDRTPEIAQKNSKVKFVQDEFKGFRTQKTKLVSIATHEWVICLDADERLDEVAIQSIKSVLNDDQNNSVFKLPRKNMMWGKWLKHGGWYPDAQIRVFRKSDAYWDGGETHESVTSRVPVSKLSGNIIHHSFRDLSHQVEKYNFYSSRMSATVKFCPVGLVIRPVLNFLRMYGLKLGFLDGMPGLIVALHSSYYTFLKYAKAWEAKQKVC